MKPGAWPAALLASVLAAPAVAPAQAETAELLGERAEGIVDVAGASGLEIDGVRGELWIRTGKGEELRFLSTRQGKGGEKLPVALSRESGILRIRPVAGTEETPRTLEMSIPSDLALGVRSSDAKVDVNAVTGEVRVEGTRLDVNLRSLGGGGALLLEASRLRVGGVAGGLHVEGRDLDVQIERVGGDLDAKLTGGRAVLRSIAGGAVIDSSDGDVTIEGLEGDLRLRARGGTVDLEGLVRGGRLDLSGAPLKLAVCRGVLEVATDSSVSFAQSEASLHIDGYGASVTGRGNKGLVEVRTDGATVDLRQVTGPVRVQGQNLDLSLDSIEGELLVIAASSRISIAGASAAVTVESEASDVAVRAARSALTVTSRGGELRLTELGGPAQVQADGPSVLVAWSALPSAQDSQVRNDGGDVEVVFPSGGRCRVEAASRFGQVEGSLPGLVAGGDGGSVAGRLNGGEQPMVRVESSGAVRLVLAEPVATGPKSGRPRREPPPADDQ